MWIVVVLLSLPACAGVPVVPTIKPPFSFYIEMFRTDTHGITSFNASFSSNGDYFVNRSTPTGSTFIIAVDGNSYMSTIIEGKPLCYKKIGWFEPAMFFTYPQQMHYRGLATVHGKLAHQFDGVSPKNFHRVTALFDAATTMPIRTTPGALYGNLLIDVYNWNWDDPTITKSIIPKDCDGTKLQPYRNSSNIPHLPELQADYAMNREYELYRTHHTKAHPTHMHWWHSASQFLTSWHAVEDNKHGSGGDLGGVQLGLTPQADIPPHLLQQQVVSVPQLDGVQHSYDEHELAATPKHFDWRTRDVVGPILDQGSCGACWAFASTQVVASALSIKYNTSYVPLSPQQLIDCAWNVTCHDCAYIMGGCNGNDARVAFHYALEHNGLATYESYPFSMNTNANCKPDSSIVKSKPITGYKALPYKNEGLMLTAVAQSPIAAVISTPLPFMLYTGGIFDWPLCPANDYSHVILVMGWGEDTEKKLPYWIIKNSFGLQWGESGYIRLQRGVNRCGVANIPLQVFV